jgi:hypothetical protein
VPPEFEDRDVTSDGWAEKTNFLPGIDLDQPGPELRYQLLQGKVFTLQLFPSGAVARGEIAPKELAALIQTDPTEDGWYHPDGRFLGDEPGLSID